MVVGGSQNSETLDPGFVLLGTRQQGVPVILKELGFVLIGTRQQVDRGPDSPVVTSLTVKLGDTRSNPPGS
ncbi:unnamed protein product, partial [Schistosoma mattheei]